MFDQLAVKLYRYRVDHVETFGIYIEELGKPDRHFCVRFPGYKNWGWAGYPAVPDYPAGYPVIRQYPARHTG